MIDSPMLAHLASIHVLLQRERKIKEPHAGWPGLQFNTWQQLDQYLVGRWVIDSPSTQEKAVR